jgi:hypothetical protein
MGRPDEEAAVEQVELGAGATEEPMEEAARLARTVRHCFNMMARQVVTVKVLIGQGYATEELREAAVKFDGWISQLGAAGTALALLDLSECLEWQKDLVDMQLCVRVAARWLEEIKAMMIAKVQEMKRRDPTIRTTPGPRPCRLAGQGCMENHSAEYLTGCQPN